MKVLSNSPWKGNIRELANFIERAVILSHGEELEVPIAELQAFPYQAFGRSTGTRYLPAHRFQSVKDNLPLRFSLKRRPCRTR